MSIKGAGTLGMMSVMGRSAGGMVDGEGAGGGGAPAAGVPLGVDVRVPVEVKEMEPVVVEVAVAVRVGLEVGVPMARPVGVRVPEDRGEVVEVEEGERDPPAWDAVALRDGVKEAEEGALGEGVSVSATGGEGVALSLKVALGA